ncbi:enoyl-CoA hydratase/isomerase family protein [Shouchella shacheensis]|uniref:enoyl-CoA hydratase/isomerase family protein n=1 Tax=Shouchella shacheensis TaxID=1649580 RepID=UPI0007401764|nr:enoyl-CoA hydratase-related protein [Shouchella shacheensis]
MSGYTYLETTVEDGVARIELNRPDHFNALNRAMVREVIEAAEAFDQDERVVVILVTGRGRAFSSGADIDEMMADDPVSLERLNPFADWDRLALIKKPIIGAVHGFVFGGGFELALCCDLVIAAAHTEFSFPEVQLGVMPGAGGTQRLTKLVGRTKALEWLFTGERIQAEAALAHAVINRIVHPEALQEEAMRLAKELAKKPPLSLRMIKDSVNKAVDASLYEGMQYERKNFYLLFASEDQTEGMQAFVEKRTPHFKGR